MKLKYLGFFIVCVTIIWSCTTDDFCLSNQNAVQAGFYSRSGAEDKDTTLSGIYVNGVGSSDLLMPYDSARINDLFLPLNFHGDVANDSTAFVIKQKRIISDKVDSISDVVIFYHQKELVFISGECGMFYNMTVDSMRFTTNLIDTVRLEYPHVKYDENIENVKIFIQP